MVMATCPECDAELEIDDDDLEEMEVGDPWDCGACGSRLRVAGLDPLEFDADDEDDEEEESDEKSEGDDEADLDEGLEDDDEDGDGEWED
jgi:alpha-aminoadipate carrier protein LysW